MTVYCHVCDKQGGRATHAGLKKMAEAGWALTTQGYAANQCPECNRKDDATKFGKLPDWVTIERKPGFDHYEVAVTVKHADAAFVEGLITAVNKYFDRYSKRRV